jgi:hypothetical protein
MASCVINLDLPRNPAKLEQRIRRVWRKGQTQAVTAVNFVTEGSIERRLPYAPLGLMPWVLTLNRTSGNGCHNPAAGFGR